MVFKKKFYNLQFGKCYLLSEKKGFYLVWVDKYFMHYVVCDFMDDMGTMMDMEFFKNFWQAYKHFRKKTKQAYVDYSKIKINNKDLQKNN